MNNEQQQQQTPAAGCMNCIIKRSNSHKRPHVKLNVLPTTINLPAHHLILSLVTVVKLLVLILPFHYQRYSPYPFAFK